MFISEDVIGSVVILDIGLRTVSCSLGTAHFTSTTKGNLTTTTTTSWTQSVATSNMSDYGGGSELRDESSDGMELDDTTNNGNLRSISPSILHRVLPLILQGAPCTHQFQLAYQKDAPDNSIEMVSMFVVQLSNSKIRQI